MARYIYKETGEVVDAEMLDGDKPIKVITRDGEDFARPGDFVVFSGGMGYCVWPPAMFENMFTPIGGTENVV